MSLILYKKYPTKKENWYHKYVYSNKAVDMGLYLASIYNNKFTLKFNYGNVKHSGKQAPTHPVPGGWGLGWACEMC